MFTSKEFADFVKRNGITHVKASPYHLSMNGLAEHAIQTFNKSSIKKFTEGILENKPFHFIFHYSLTSQTATGQPPA